MGSVVEKLMPARSAAKEGSFVVDLDDLVAKSVAFKFRGKLYEVQPVSAQKFMELAEKLGEAGHLLTRSQAGEEIHDSELYSIYQDFIGVLVPNFTANILREMQLPQVHALINLIIKHATGQPMSLDQITEKKNLRLGLR